ncbi:MAG: LysR substrate-binding domain-containing protein [Azospirillaceae bacterium]|nr:LysR substrate-binding domain-containing protein [Azospirillaceae bacterium]
MDLHQLRCFVAVAEELHFGHAAQRLAMLPSALGRQVRLLEEDLGTRLLNRTTRNVAVTEEGAGLLDEARALLAQADDLAARYRARGRSRAATLRVGAIDSAAAGLVPMLLHDFRERHPDVVVQLVEDKTIRLLPRLLSGRLDLAFVRPPESADKSLEFLFLFHESVVVAVPADHVLAGRDHVRVADLADQPLIVPERRSRPHSHDLTIKLFAEAGLTPRITQYAEEKQTIINLVGAGLGVAIVPRWTARMVTPAVRFIPLVAESAGGSSRLPLAASWVGGTHDAMRDQMLAVLQEGLATYAGQA